MLSYILCFNFKYEVGICNICNSGHTDSNLNDSSFLLNVVYKNIKSVQGVTYLHFTRKFIYFIYNN